MNNPIQGSDEQLKNQCMAAWNASPDIQQEFVDFDVYRHYRKAEAQGRVRRISNL